MTESAELRDEVAAAIAAESGSKAAADGGHPSFDELVAYSTGEFGTSEAEQIEQHLTHCKACVDLMLDLDGFLQPQAEASEVTTIHTARAWRDLRRVLPGRRQQPRLLAAAASALLVLGLAALVFHQQRTVRRLGAELALLETAQPDAPILDLFPRSAVRGIEADPGVVAGGPGFVTLVLNLPSAAPDGPVTADFVSMTGEVLWSGPLEPSEFGTFRLAVPLGWLDPAGADLGSPDRGSPDRGGPEPGGPDLGGAEVRLYAAAGGRERVLLEIFPIETQGSAGKDPAKQDPGVR